MPKRFLIAALSLLTAQAASALPPAAQQFVDAVQKAQTLSVNVTRPADTPGGPDETAHVLLARPNKIRVTLQRGPAAAGTLLSDGKTLFEWNSQQFSRNNAPATLADLSPPFPLGLPADIGGSLLTQPALLLDTLKLTDAGSETVGGVATHRLTRALTSGDAGGSGQVTLWLSDATHFPVQMSLQGGGKTFTLTFKNYAVGQAVAADAFTAPPQALTAGIPASALTPLPAGTPAPDFSLAAPDGKLVTLSGLRGRVVLLHFWTSLGDTSAPALARFQKLQQDLGAKGLTVLAVNSWDKREALTAFLAKHPEFSGLTVFDPTLGAQSVSTGKYNVTGLPTDYVVDKEGRVAAVFTGFDPDGDTPIRAALAKLGVQ